jgi:hypothetical protein
MCVGHKCGIVQTVAGVGGQWATCVWPQPGKKVAVGVGMGAAAPAGGHCTWVPSVAGFCVGGQWIGCVYPQPGKNVAVGVGSGLAQQSVAGQVAGAPLGHGGQLSAGGVVGHWTHKLGGFWLVGGHGGQLTAAGVVTHWIEQLCGFWLVGH